MSARIGTSAIVVFWAVMMGWIAWHDLRPAWTAQDPPKTLAADLPLSGPACFQVGIFDRRGDRIGTAWTAGGGGHPKVHYNEPGWDERQCQQQLMQWRQQVGFEDIAPEIQHGLGD
ncbi:MAG: hypothetical protein V2A79_00960 [Planctomycetota bacterium]